MTAMTYFSFAVNLVAAALMIVQLFRISRLPDEAAIIRHHFRRFAWVVLAMALLDMVYAWADMHLDGMKVADFLKLPKAELEGWIWTAMAVLIVDIFLTTFFFYMWLIFLSIRLFDDRDFIRNRFWAGYIPLMLSAVVAAASVPLAVMSEQGLWFFVIAVVLFFLIRVFYFFLALWLLREYKKQNGYLRFFNPWGFFVPVFAGWVIQDIFEISLSALGSTLGIMMLYQSIIIGLNYMDRETGFYTMDFVGYLKDLVSKKRYDPYSAMSFTLDSSKEMKDFSALLISQLPENCEPILRNDHEIVVLTSVRERGPLIMVMEDVKSLCEIKADCTLRKKTETPAVFMERVL